MRESETTQQNFTGQGLSFWQHGVVFLLAMGILVWRRPDAVFHAQIYAEDGYVWFAGAYNLGWLQALFKTYAGYFEVLPRLGASLALLLPFSAVPLFLNLIGFAFQALSANLLLLARSSTWGNLRFRSFLAGMYLVLPNCDEVGRGITNGQWTLALGAFIILTAAIPRGTAGRFFDISFLLLCGLSGPFCIFLLPLSIFLAWRDCEPWRRVTAAILTGCCLVQVWALLFLDPASRAHRALGASPGLFARIVGSQIYLGALLGNNALSAMPGHRLGLVLICIAIGGTAFAIVCAIKSPLPLKIFSVFSVAVFAAGLINPFEFDHPTIPIWVVYAGIGGLRYWFFPTLAFAWALLFGSQSRILFVKVVSIGLLMLMCIGIYRSWRQPPYSETNFGDSVNRFEAAPSGTKVVIPEFPQGRSMTLVKH